ncbi:MAG: hypothetical protein ACI9TY_000949 [Alphaproteobacteria bacterium]|jgi:hypothetical protein
MSLYIKGMTNKNHPDEGGFKFDVVSRCLQVIEQLV